MEKYYRYMRSVTSILTQAVTWESLQIYKKPGGGKISGKLGDLESHPQAAEFRRASYLAALGSIQLPESMFERSSYVNGHAARHLGYRCVIAIVGGKIVDENAHMYVACTPDCVEVRYHNKFTYGFDAN
jgi:hypothetical protein